MTRFSPSTSPVGQGAPGRSAMAHKGSTTMVWSRATCLRHRAHGQVWGQGGGTP